MNEEIYRNAIERIECDSKYRPTGCCCGRGRLGPTGPTGPQGPATIEVGTTTTSAPGTAASVTNSGTNVNAIFDFVIPAGATGPQGLVGPTGPTARLFKTSKKLAVAS